MTAFFVSHTQSMAGRLSVPAAPQSAYLTPTLSASLVPGGVLRAHGVLHLLFRPAPIAKPGQADALLESGARFDAATLDAAANNEYILEDS